MLKEKNNFFITVWKKITFLDFYVYVKMFNSSSARHDKKQRKVAKEGT